MLFYFFATVSAASLSGQLLDSQDEAVTGVSVYAIDHRLGYAAATSTNDGSWQIEGLPAGRYRVWVTPPDSAKFPSRFFPDHFQYCDGEVLEVEQEASREELDIVLPDGGAIVGQVFGADGAPLVGAEVEAEGSGYTQGYRRKALTDSSGQYIIRGLEAQGSSTEAYSLEVDANGYPIQYLGLTYLRDESGLVDVGLGEEVAIESMTLMPGQGVAGRVSSEGVGVAGASVFLYAEGQVLTAVTDGDGYYEKWALPPGEVLSWASADGYGLTYYPDVDRPGETLPGAGEGELLDGVDLDLPVESGLQLRLSGEWEDLDLSGVTVLAYNDTYTVGIGDSSDADGQIQIGRLHPGTYFVFAYAAAEGLVDDFFRNAQGEPQAFEVTGPESEVYEVSLPFGAIFSGRIEDETGAPVYGAQVSAIPSDPTARTQSDMTDHDGRYTIDGLVEGSYRLRVSYSIYCGDDPGFVTAWWPDARTEERSASIRVSSGDVADDLHMVSYRDDDHDQMADEWERFYGLNPALDDSGEDPDQDGYTNGEEYLLSTNPMDESSNGACGGCNRGSQSVVLVFPLLCFGIGRRGRR